LTNVYLYDIIYVSKQKGDKMENFIKANEGLIKASINASLVKRVRASNVNEAINAVIDYYKQDGTIFSSKKNCISVFIKSVLNDKAVDKYTKRAVTVAKTILVDGYKFRREFLTLSQMEQLSKFDSKRVNELMSEEDEEEYILSVKALINEAKVIRQTKVFSASVAKTL